VLAAFPPELAPLRPLLGDALRAQVGGVDVAAAAVGIGLATAAAGTATRLPAFAPRGVVLVGTCGSYGDTPPIGAVAVASRVVLAEPAVVTGEAAFPEPMSIETAADRALAAGLAAAGGAACDVATTLAITTSDRLAARIASHTSCHAEHLEAYGVAAACAALGIPFATALGVANRVGSRAREEWRVGHRAASAAAVAVVLAWMRLGFRGLAPRR
jgi:futalosine hydrolase